MVSRKRASSKEITGWAMFDFANQAYTLLIITVIFGDLFTRVIVGPIPGQPDDYRWGNLLWSTALAISYGLVVITNPLAGAIMDSTRLRKQFLFASYLGCVITTAMLWFIEPGWIAWAMVLLILSNYCYAMGESFIASFLPGLGPKSDLGWISGLGWGLGYVGGLVATAFALGFLGEVSLANYDRIRYVGPFCALFFMLAAIPTFVYVKDRTRRVPRDPNDSYWLIGWQRLQHTWRELDAFVDLKRLLLSIFFMMAGLYIVISFAFIYGAQVIGWDESIRVLMFVIVQITATVGAFAFGWLHHPWGQKRTYIATLVLWLAAIALVWQTPAVTDWINKVWALDIHPQQTFLVAGVLCGLSLGASQSAGRALVGALTPRSKNAEFFGFWGTVSKLAAVVGLIGLGVLQAWLGLANAIAFCLLLLMLGLAYATTLNIERGMEVANRWRG